MPSYLVTFPTHLTALTESYASQHQKYISAFMIVYADNCYATPSWLLACFLRLKERFHLLKALHKAPIQENVRMSKA